MIVLEGFKENLQKKQGGIVMIILLTTMMQPLVAGGYIASQQYLGAEPTTQNTQAISIKHEHLDDEYIRISVKGPMDIKMIMGIKVNKWHRLQEDGSIKEINYDPNSIHRRILRSIKKNNILGTRHSK